jgi:hypothetical protein
LWYCDLTTSPDGEPVSARERIAEIKERYGPGDIVTQFITEGAAELLAAVERTERRLTSEQANLAEIWLRLLLQRVVYAEPH